MSKDTGLVALFKASSSYWSRRARGISCRQDEEEPLQKLTELIRRYIKDQGPGRPELQREIVVAMSGQDRPIKFIQTMLAGLLPDHVNSAAAILASMGSEFEAYAWSVAGKGVDDSHYRVYALAMARIGSRRAGRYIHNRHVRSRSVAAREAAAEALGAFDDPKSRKLLRSLAASDSSERVRARAEKTLKGLATG